MDDATSEDSERPDEEADEGNLANEGAGDHRQGEASPGALAGSPSAALSALYPGMQSFFQAYARSVEQSLAPVRASMTALSNSMQFLRAFDGLFLRTLSRQSDFAEVEAAPSAYSNELTNAGEYFRGHEGVIDSFDDLHRAITKLIQSNPDLSFAWRGVRRASWGLHSSLYRHLMSVNGVIPPDEMPLEVQPYPDEVQMVAAEREILRLARQDWRFDDQSALETFARIQHVGGPTRLIDVTRNPYIGAWFAVEENQADDTSDARLFALATNPVPQTSGNPEPEVLLQLDDLGRAREPFWHILETPELRQQADWGTGARRRLWIPPAWHPRMLAQNAAFLVDGVPMVSRKTMSYFKKPQADSGVWKKADLLAAASVYARTVRATSRARHTITNFAPTFTFRISAAAKAEIRAVLEARFGYRYSSIYPDVEGLAAYLNRADLALPQ